MHQGLVPSTHEVANRLKGDGTAGFSEQFRIGVYTRRYQPVPVGLGCGRPITVRKTKCGDGPASGRPAKQ